MILYRKKPFNCKMKNIIVLDAGVGEGCIYVSKETYEQAVSIGITFSKDKDRIEKSLGKTIDGWMIVPGMYTAYNKIFDLLPKPLNMLSIFIAFAAESGIDWKKEDEELIETACGVLHTISQFVDFYSILLTPVDARQKLEIPKHVYTGYQESWDSLIGTLEDDVVTVSKDDIKGMVEAAIGDSIGSIIDDKIKEAVAGIKIETPTQEASTVDVSEQITEKLNEVLPEMVKGLIPVQQQAPVPYPYMMPPMYQQPVYQQPVYQQPIQQIQTQVTTTPQAQPVSQPQVVTQPIQQTAPIQQETEEFVVTESGEEVSMADIENLYKEIAEKDSSEILGDDYKSSTPTPAPTVKEEPKILTEQVKKEKSIAEESIKIIQSYDL